MTENSNVYRTMYFRDAWTKAEMSYVEQYCKRICTRFEHLYGGTAVAQWLRCCATNRKVTGSIPDGVNGIFHWHNTPNRNMALGSTQPLTEMSTRRISCASGAYGWQPDQLPVPLSWNLGNLTSCNPLGHSRPLTGLIYLYLYLLVWLKNGHGHFTFLSFSFSLSNILKYNCKIHKVVTVNKSVIEELIKFMWFNMLRNIYKETNKYRSNTKLVC